MYWQDHFIDNNRKAILIEEKPSAAIFKIEGTNLYFVTDMSHPGDVYPEENNLTLEQAEEAYNRK